MSKHDKIAKLKEYIKNFVIKELEKDEELDEVSTTATAGIDGTGTGHYDTPKAFSSGSAVGHKSPEVGGYKKVNESYVSSGKVSDVFLKLKSKGFGNKKFGDISKELSKHYKTPGLADVMASMFKEIWMKGKKKEAEKEVLDWLKTVAKKSKLESVKEDIDVGHQDDEPDMLKSTAMEIVDYGKKLYDALEKYDEMEDEVDFPNWWQSKLIVSKEYLQKAYHYLDSEEKKDGVQESINESQPFADFPKFPKLSRDQQESLDELFGFAESYQIFNSFNNNPKKFIQTLDDMAKIRKASNKQPKGVNFNKGKKQFVKEATKQEVNALKKFIKDFQKMEQQYWKIAKMGDKELTNAKYNKHYETILAATKSIAQLGREIQEKERIGEGLNETVKKEVDAVNKVLQNLKKLRQDYIKIYNMGDKTLKAKHFNKYYEIFLNAEKEITTLHQTLKGHIRNESINEGRYHDWRNDESLTPKQKIGKSMREIRDALNELDKTVKMNLKLKTELKMKSEDYWKNTHKALTKISERLVKMANKVGNLK